MRHFSNSVNLCDRTVYSTGTGDEAGSSVIEYIKRESKIRNIEIIHLDTTEIQDILIENYLNEMMGMEPSKGYSFDFTDSCATRTDDALDLLGIKDLMNEWYQEKGILRPVIVCDKAKKATTKPIDLIPKGSQTIPEDIKEFEPKAGEKIQ